MYIYFRTGRAVAMLTPTRPVENKCRQKTGQCSHIITDDGEEDGPGAAVDGCASPVVVRHVNGVVLLWMGQAQQCQARSARVYVDLCSHDANHAASVVGQSALVVCA